MFWWRWLHRRGKTERLTVRHLESAARYEMKLTNSGMRGLNQPFRYLLKKSSVRCQDSLAAASS